LKVFVLFVYFVASIFIFSHEEHEAHRAVRRPFMNCPLGSGLQTMNIIIVGAGTVGSNIAELLLQENHNITVIDLDKVRLQELGEQLDIRTLHGYGASQEVLAQAGISNAQLLLAVTNNDEINMISAFTAKQMGARKTVARVRNRCYLDATKLNYRRFLGIDLIISPEILTAVEIVRFLDDPDAVALAHYAHGKVQLRQLVLNASSRLVGRPLRTISLPESVLVVSIVREKALIIPKGNDQLLPGDKITIIGIPERMTEVQRMFKPPSPEVERIVIAGGGGTGLFLAETLEQRDYKVKLVEANRERCHSLSEVLTRTSVVHGDVTKLPFLLEERIGNADVFIAVTGDDETNVMSSVLAKEIGVKQCVTKVERPDYADVLQKMGIDLVLSPRLVTANKILALVKRGIIKSVSIFEEGKIEVIEFQAMADSKVVNKPLSQVGFPKGTLVAALVKHSEVRVPRGSDVIEPGDLVIVVGLTEVIDELEALFHSQTEVRV
jgi:trk system potassium uptake protein TrkA